ncbi:ABC transporter substrate-binding protein [Muricomes sp. OA1]|uniref:Carbohydrate ABC transporter substrate-binding protein n=2 Tax=Lachnospiraceae TaxID=186803 RepID=A0A3E2WQ76_9FIRM|nr:MULTISPECIES: ABC transporter substrate-binding protein [Clostridia]MCH1971863.1 ABC transporter substrate-binding protein [Muricomes sp. OA1]RGC29358.1 carbohydrate ABC transporter substrate-binding protein [Hungatella hathewayi]GKH30662.1 putative binding protein MsmE [Faecalicatena contorta]
MKRRLKKLAAFGLAAVMTTGLLAGCGNGQAGSEKTDSKEADKSAKKETTLEVEVIYTGQPLDQFREVLDGFTEETGIGIELVTPGSDYEAVMKTRMASGEMPDVFVTHGWSIARYKEYLTALNDEEWYDRIDDPVLPIISDEDGSIYVLPVSQVTNGVVYNKTVLENAGVNVGDIRTMDDFKDACEKIKASGVTPFFVGGKDTWTAAVLYNAMAPAFYTTEGCKYPSGEELKDGTFDWDTKGSCVLEEIADMVQAGYFNKDLVTADNAATLTALGEDACGFSTEVEIVKVLNVAPDAQLGIMPIPCTTEEGKSQYMIGEGSCFGIWKDTEKMDEAKQFLNYLAKPEVADKIMELDGGLPALKDMNTENVSYKAFSESQEIFEGDIFYDNLFDREYFPSGMFNADADAVIEVFMDPTEKGINAGLQHLKSTFQDKYVAAE